MKIPFSFLLIFTFLYTFYSCEKSSTSLNLSGLYYGYWAETNFKYKFKNDGNFTFTTEGHFGFTTTKGKYALIDSVVLLYPFTDWTTYHGVLKQELILINNKRCLKGNNNEYYCKDDSSLIELSSKYYDLEEKIIKRLYELPKVKDIMIEYPDTISFNIHRPKFDFRVITLIDNEAYHQFILSRYMDMDEEDYHIAYPYEYYDGQRYFVNIHNNTIYRHHSSGDSLSVVNSLF